MTDTANSDFQKLYDYEYGCGFEMFLRFAFFVTATVLLTLETGWLVGPIWLAIYYPVYLANYAFFRWRLNRANQRDVMIASVMFIALIGVFIWLPGYLLLQTEYLSLQFVGAAGIGGLLLWLIKRSDHIPHLMWGEITCLGLSFCVLFYFAAPKFGSLNEQIVVFLCGPGLLYYFTQVVLRTRDQRRRAELAAKRTAEAQKMEALGQMAGGVAHDFNNILTATVGNLELHREVPTAFEKEQCLEEALLAARRGEALVRRLLMYGRPEAEETNSSRLWDMLDNLRVLSRRLVPAQVRVCVKSQEPDLALPVREEDLTTTLLNLMINARDSMPNGGQINVFAEQVHLEHARILLDGTQIAPGTYLQLQVTDTGPGIPPEILRHVLEPFFTTKPAGEGSGLGLPMAATFAREAGGGLTIATSAKGTRVSLLLPFERAAPISLEADAA